MMNCSTSFPQDKIGEIGDHRLPLSVQLKHTKLYDELLSPAEAERQLTDLFEQHGGPVVNAAPLAQTAFGTGIVNATFFHPGSWSKFFNGNGPSDLVHQKRLAFKLTMDISECPEHLSLWIGGCPDWKENIDEFKGCIMRSLNDGYELDILEDPLRRELLVVSTVPINNPSFKSEMSIMIRRALTFFENNAIKWKELNRLLLVKGASDVFVEKWKQRLDGRLPLSDDEKELMQWTQEILEKRRIALGIPPTVPENPKKASPKKTSKTPAKKRRLEQSEEEKKEGSQKGEEDRREAKKGKKEDRVDGNHNDLADNRTDGIDEKGEEPNEQVEQMMTIDHDQQQQVDPRLHIEAPLKITPEHFNLPSLRNLLERILIKTNPTPMQRRTRDSTYSRGSCADGGQASSSTESSSSSQRSEAPSKGKGQKAVAKKQTIIPCYLHPEEAEEKKRKYKEDFIVRKLQVRLEKERRERGEGPLVISMKISKNDFASITRKADKMHAWLHSDEEQETEEEQAARLSKKGKKSKKRKMVTCHVKKIAGAEKKFIIDGLPFTTPTDQKGNPSYDLVKTMDDSQGPLECYATRQPTVKTDEHNGEGPAEPAQNPDPSYIFVSESEHFEDNATLSQYHDLRESNKCETTCACEGVCKPETCACIQRSLYVDGKIQEHLMTEDRWTVYECCSKCSCQKRKEKCPSKVEYRKMKFHLAHFTNMGFALRVMEPVVRGEPIVPFTGVYESAMTEENKDWAFTCTNLAEAWMRKFTGIKESTSCTLLTPRYKGNSGGRICHSKDSNCEFMRVYRGGLSTLLPEVLIFATETMEAGELLWLDYGEDYWSQNPDQQCLCLAELCHDEEVIAWMKTLNYDQIRQVLIDREMLKRKRIIHEQLEVLKALAAQQEEEMKEDNGENMEEMEEEGRGENMEDANEDNEDEIEL